MRSVLLVAAGLALSAAACSRDLTSGMPGPVTSHDVAITTRLGGRGPIGDTVTIHIANTGTSAAYFPQCGNQPLLLTQQFVNGQWIGGVQNFMCLSSVVPGPVIVPPGGALDVVRVYQPGRYRVSVSVASDFNLSDPTPALSAAFDAP
jgi:hypothetical protein